jgi:hypothetical protein
MPRSFQRLFGAQAHVYVQLLKRQELATVLAQVNIVSKPIHFGYVKNCYGRITEAGMPVRASERWTRIL